MAETKEQYLHDVCPECGEASVPAEKVPDQALRGCSSCGHVWVEDLTRPPRVRKEEAARLAYLEAEAEHQFAGWLVDDVVLSELAEIFGLPPCPIRRRRFDA